MTTTDTAPTKPTPFDKKTERLQAQLAKIDAEISAVQARHSVKIADADRRVAGAESTYKAETDDLALLDGRIAGLEDNIASLHRQLEVEKIKLANARAWQGARSTHVSIASERLATERAARDTNCAEPFRHTAALRKDRDALVYRIQQHLARQPHTALFIGSKS